MPQLRWRTPEACLSDICATIDKVQGQYEELEDALLDASKEGSPAPLSLTEQQELESLQKELAAIDGKDPMAIDKKERVRALEARARAGAAGHALLLLATKRTPPAPKEARVINAERARAPAHPPPPRCACATECHRVPPPLSRARCACAVSLSAQRGRE